MDSPTGVSLTLLSSDISVPLKRKKTLRVAKHFSPFSFTFIYFSFFFFIVYFLTLSFFLFLYLFLFLSFLIF